MVELVDNTLQFLVTSFGCIWSGVLFCRSRKQAYFLLTCFYGCFAVAGLYWTLYYLLFSETPQIFYVSELGWISGYIFLYLLQYTFSDQDERAFKCGAAWISLVLGIPLMLFYCTFGDILSNVVICGMMMLLSWNAIRGLVYLQNGREVRHKLRNFHVVVVCFVATEYGLWTSGCFWVSNTMSNPYFWFDFLLTALIWSLLPITRKVVEA